MAVQIGSSSAICKQLNFQGRSIDEWGSTETVQDDSTCFPLRHHSDTAPKWSEQQNILLTLDVLIYCNKLRNHTAFVHKYCTKYNEIRMSFLWMTQLQNHVCKSQVFLECFSSTFEEPRALLLG